MRAYMLTHLSDRELLRELVALVAQERATTAALLAHVAEVDVRRLYVPAGYPSMFAYCVQELHLSEDAAYKRIRAARTARRFPALFNALAEGRLHLTAVVFLAPHLTEDNADELIAAAAHKNKSEVECLLAQSFPKPDVPFRLRSVALEATSFGADQLVPEPVGTQGDQGPGPAEAATCQLVREPVAAPRPKVKPLSPQRFALQLTIDQSMHDKLRYAQSLLSHQIPSGDVAQVLDRALDALVSQLEKQKFAATNRPQTGPRRKATGKRTIPAHVKRAVWERDRGQCTFVGATGHRCSARKFLEFDHVDPVARGGQATVEGMRLRCRAHNQYEAEQTFGAGFMIDKREAARRGRESARASAAERARIATAERARTTAAERAHAAAAERDVMAALRTLGYRADESRRATAHSASLAGSSLEERVRLALSYFRPRAYSHTRAVPRLGRAS